MKAKETKVLIFGPLDVGKTKLLRQIEEFAWKRVFSIRKEKCQESNLLWPRKSCGRGGLALMFNN